LLISYLLVSAKNGKTCMPNACAHTTTIGREKCVRLEPMGCCQFECHIVPRDDGFSRYSAAMARDFRGLIEKTQETPRYSYAVAGASGASFLAFQQSSVQPPGCAKRRVARAPTDVRRRPAEREQVGVRRDARREPLGKSAARPSMIRIIDIMEPKSSSLAEWTDLQARWRSKANGADGDDAIISAEPGRRFLQIWKIRR